jgi:hypothetical protein
MALDAESFDLLLATVPRVIRERLIPAETTWKSTTQVQPIIIGRELLRTA